HLVLGGVTGGEEDHRRGRAVGAQATADLEAVEVREHHVEQQDVGPEVLGRVERLATRRRLHHVHLGVPQGGDEQVADVLLVVDDEDSGRTGGGGGGGHGGQSTARR